MVLRCQEGWRSWVALPRGARRLLVPCRRSPQNEAQAPNRSELWSARIVGSTVGPPRADG